MSTPDSLLHEVNSCVNELGFRIDRRIIAFEVQPEVTEKEIVLKGFVHVPKQEVALLNNLAELPSVMKKKIPVRSRLKVLMRKPRRFFQVSVPFGNLRKEPRAGSELGTDVLFGCYVAGYFTKGNYWYGSDPTGYLGYIHKDQVVEKSPGEYLAWLNGRRGRFLKNFRLNGHYFPLGAEFGCVEDKCILLPSGKTLRLENGAFLSYKPGEGKEIDEILERAHTFLGAPYLWGGNTDKGIDCSGFCQMLYLLRNVALPRDSSQQVGYGRQVGVLGDFSDLLPGDLLFFMGRQNRIIHVALYLGGKRFIHASKKEGITISHIEDPDFAGGSFRDAYVFGRRIFF
ncbi:C40 family peptidase [Candidatus Sumerlaeota bacterium]|nr:C40 family peptidase [Candidatus Sumerlaeota bacterium]